MSRTMSILVAAALAGGCAGEVHTRGTAMVSASTTPDLVYAAPGVSVIADYDEPIFFSNGFYWWNYGGYWYRSRHYTGGWIHATPPIAILRLRDPHRFRRFRPPGYVARSRPVPPQRLDRPRLDRPRPSDRRAGH